MRRVVGGGGRAAEVGGREGRRQRVHLDQQEAETVDVGRPAGEMPAYRQTIATLFRNKYGMDFSAFTLPDAGFVRR